MGAQVAAPLVCGYPYPEGSFTPQENKDLLPQRSVPQRRFQWSHCGGRVRKSIITKEEALQNSGGAGRVRGNSHQKSTFDPEPWLQEAWSRLGASALRPPSPSSWYTFSSCRGPGVHFRSQRFLQSLDLGSCLEASRVLRNPFWLLMQRRFSSGG